MLMLERRREVQRDELADALWPRQLPGSWGGALRGVVSKVRLFLRQAGFDGVEALTSGYGCYQLHLPAGVKVDIEEAFAAVDRADAELQRGDVRRALHDLAAARPTLGRPFLSGEEGRWVDRQRADLDELLSRALALATDAHLQAGDPIAAVIAAEELLARRPVSDAAHRLLIRAHAAADGRSAGLAAYERCRTLLDREMGVAPEAETVALRDRLLVESGHVPPQIVQRTDRSAAAFVGRQQELGELRDAWRVGLQGACVALITGEAGIGKTALAAELSGELARSGVNVLNGRCESVQTLSYQPMVEALESHLHAIGPSEAGFILAGQALLAPIVGWAAEGGTQKAILDADATRYRLFQAMAEVLRRISERAPVLFAIDDAELLNADTALALRHAVRHLHDRPALFLVIARSPDWSLSVPLTDLISAVEEDGRLAHVDIGGLTASEAASFAAGLLPDADDGVLDAIEQRTGGNPLVAAQLIAWLTQSRGDPAFITPAAVAMAPVAPAVLAGLRRRRALLRTETQQLLEAGAVLGSPFSFEDLVMVSGRKPMAVLDGLEEAIAVGFLKEVVDLPSSLEFCTSPMQSLFYDGLGQVRRARLHRAVEQLGVEVSTIRTDRQASSGLALHPLKSVEPPPGGVPRRTNRVPVQSKTTASSDPPRR